MYFILKCWRMISYLFLTFQSFLCPCRIIFLTISLMALGVSTQIHCSWKMGYSTRYPQKASKTSTAMSLIWTKHFYHSVWMLTTVRAWWASMTLAWVFQSSKSLQNSAPVKAYLAPRWASKAPASTYMAPMRVYNSLRWLSTAPGKSFMALSVFPQLRRSCDGEPPLLIVILQSFTMRHHGCKREAQDHFGAMKVFSPLFINLGKVLYSGNAKGLLPGTQRIFWHMGM